MSNTNSIQILFQGAVAAVKSQGPADANALFDEYVSAMRGAGPHKQIVATDLPALEQSVRSAIASETKGSPYAKLEAGVDQRVSSLFTQIRQAAQRIDELEKVETDPAQRSKQVEQDLAEVEPIMAKLYALYNGLGEMGMGQMGYDAGKLNEMLSSFRVHRRQAAEILMPLNAQTAQLNDQQAAAVDRHYKNLVGWLTEVRRGMGLNG